MGTARDFAEIVAFIKESQNSIQRAMAKAMLKTTLQAEAMAKRNSTEQFTGRHGRTLQGGILNSIYSSFDVGSSEVSGWVGVRNIPYGRVHEFGSGGLPGGVITPNHPAEHLWIPRHRVAGKMTPREFIGRMKANPGMYHLFDKMAGKWTGGYRRVAGKKRKIYTPIFWLVDKVKIPERPYVRPAVEKASENYPANFAEMLAKE